MGKSWCFFSRPLTHIKVWRLDECCFTSTQTVGLLGTGAQDGHLDFHTAGVWASPTVHHCADTGTSGHGVVAS